MENTKERNYAIDFLRGIAAICIVLIHTAWWSGTGYLPSWFSNLFLIVDVPIFMFISGITYNFVQSVCKNIKNLLSQWNKWIFFLILYMIITLILFKNEFDYTQMFNYFFYEVPKYEPLRVVGGSVWFLSMYIKVTLVGSIVLYFYNQHKDKIKYIYILLLVLLLSANNTIIDDPYIPIYSFFYFLGYYAYSNKIKSLRQLIFFESITVIFVSLVFIVSGFRITHIQLLKFPPTIYYLMISIPGILLVWYLKDRLKISKKNPMNYVGKNAIYFFFSQGVSSSLLYYILPKIHIANTYIKFCFLASLNIIMAIIIGTAIACLYNITVKILSKIKPHIQKYFVLDKINQ